MVGETVLLVLFTWPDVISVKPGQKTIKPKRSLHEVNRWNQQARNKPLVAKISLAALGQGNDDSEEAETSNSDQVGYDCITPIKAITEVII